MISAPLLEVVAVPRLRPAARSGPAIACACTGCGRVFDRAGGYLDLRPRDAFAEQTKYLDEALHADARHESIAPPAARIEDPQRHAAAVPGARAGRSRRRSRLRQRTHARVERRRGAALTGIDISPFFAREAVDRCDLLLGDLRRLPIRDGAFTKAWSLDVLEHLSPQALARRARAKPTACCADDGALFVYTHVRKNGWLAGGVRLVNRLARFCERLGLLDLRQERLRKSDHLNPLADHDDLARVVARVRLPHRAHHVLHAHHRRVRRERARAHGGAVARRRRAAARHAGRDQPRTPSVTRARRRRRVSPPRRDVSRARGAHGGHEARRPAVRPRPVRAVLRAAPQDGTDAPCQAMRRMRILYVALDQTVPGHARRIGARAGGRRGPGGARPRGPRRDAARRRVAGRAGSTWHAMAPPLGRAELRWLRARRGRARWRAQSAPTSSSSATTTSAAKACSRRADSACRPCSR